MKKRTVRFLAAMLVGAMVFSAMPTLGVKAAEETDIAGEATGEEKGQPEIAGESETGTGIKEETSEDQQQNELETDEENEKTGSDEPLQSTEEIENENDFPDVNDDEKEEREQSGKKEIEEALNYIFVNAPYVEAGHEQVMVVSWGDGTENITNMQLTLEDESGDSKTIEQTKQEENCYMFAEYFNEGVYHLSEIAVETEDGEKEFDLEEMGISAYFGVGEEYNGDEKSDYIEMESVVDEAVETNIVTIDEEGIATAQDDIAEALEEIVEETGITQMSSFGVYGMSAESLGAASDLETAVKTVDTTSELVVVLDPGHDSKHAGAQGNGVKEEVATLEIAKYCKEELEKYSGVKVLMTRTTAACPFPNSANNIADIKERVKWASQQGADVFVSIHLNSASAAAKGAEVYYPKTSSVGKALAEKIQNELTAIGLYDRGAKADDEYAVINASTSYGFPGLIIEHAFVTNSSDATNYLTTAAGLKKLGVADATGIAKYYELSKQGTSTANGWVTSTTGEKYYYINNQKVYGEKKINGKWYYFDTMTGVMQTGWVDFATKKVYYDIDGSMVYGEKKIDGKWYYFDKTTGKMRTGWVDFTTKKVYYDADGSMVYGEKKIDGKWYYFDKTTGKMTTGWVDFTTKKVYYDADGSMVYGEKKIDGKWYYFDKTTGKMTTGWVDFPTKKVYYDADGSMAYGEKKIDGKWYYFDKTTGKMMTGWVDLSTKRAYYGTDGSMVYGEMRIDGKWYYFDKVTGAMLAGKVMNGYYYNLEGERTALTKIEGKTATTVSQMASFYTEKSPITYPGEKLGEGGADTIEVFAQIYYEEAMTEGIKPEVAWCQCMYETGWLQFNGAVKIEQFNFAGLGTTGGEVQGADFSTYGEEGVRMGIRAHIQHLKAYASSTITIDSLKTACVDPRFNYVSPKGCAEYVEYLGQQENPDNKGWATSANYGLNIRSLLERLAQY